MATIIPQGQSVPQQPAQQSSQTPNPNQDPLFEALVKYITSGPGPSSVTSAQVQDIINSHGEQAGGRDYLEALVAPSANVKMWKNHATVSGYVSSNMHTLTISIDSPQVKFNGTCGGLYPPQVLPVNDGTLFYDDLTDNMSVALRVKNHANVSIFTVQFMDGDNTVAELAIPRSTLHLPDYEIPGSGLFNVKDDSQ